MEIRKAALADAKGIAKVQVDSWETTYRGIVPEEFLSGMRYAERERTWKSHIPKQAVFVAVDQEEVIGFSLGGLERTGNYPSYQGELYAIYILEEHQGKGIGRALFEMVVQQLFEQNISTMMICALEENPACGFYEALGGKKIDVLETDISAKKLNEVVYGWEDTQIMNPANNGDVLLNDREKRNFKNQT